MPDLNNPDYYARRERQERDLADCATMPEIRAIHAGMADQYAVLAGRSEDAATPRIHI